MRQRFEGARGRKLEVQNRVRTRVLKCLMSLGAGWIGKLGVSSGLEFAILVAREADAEQAANLKRVDDSASGPKQSTAGTCCFKCK